MQPKSVLRFLVFAISFSILLSQSAFAQTDQGRIVGTVTDSVGAIVPGAMVEVINEKTGETRTVKTNEDGLYIVTALKASFYTIKISQMNFATAESKNVQLSVGQELNYSIQLQPEGATANVTVVSESEAAINTSSASMSANVNQREVEGLPVNGRQLSQLYLQAPGAVNSGSGTFGDIRFSGRAVQQNIIRYDGVEGTAIIDSSPGNLNGEVPIAVSPAIESGKHTGIPRRFEQFPCRIRHRHGRANQRRDQIGRQSISRLGL